MKAGSFEWPNPHTSAECRDTLRLFCGGGGDPKEAPFPNHVDMWFMAICVAFNEGLEPIKPKAGDEVINTIPASAIDPTRSYLLQMVAVSETGDVEVLKTPARVLSIVNGYARAGFPHLKEILNNSESNPLDNLSDYVAKKMS